MTRLRRRHALLAVAGLVAGRRAAARELAAPNVVAITPRLVTSGQPSAAALASLAQHGFEAVIYLAPSTVADAVRDEPDLLARQGIEFVHVPIPFDAPEARHVAAVLDALDRLQAKKVLVHCQVNLRASSLVFLHRVLRGHADPAQAYEAVARVWSPGGPWRRLLVAQLREHGLAFEPY